MGWQNKVHWASVVIMPYFPATGLQLLRYHEVNGLQFQMAAVRHLDFQKVRNFRLIFNFDCRSCS